MHVYAWESQILYSYLNVTIESCVTSSLNYLCIVPVIVGGCGEDNFTVAYGHVQRQLLVTDEYPHRRWHIAGLQERRLRMETRSLRFGQQTRAIRRRRRLIKPAAAVGLAIAS
jgi:hypothetical protein